MSLSGAMAALGAFPRSIDRGLIEAPRRPFASPSRAICPFPRSIDRGLIEAVASADCAQYFGLRTFPRSIDRGLIEAHKCEGNREASSVQDFPGLLIGASLKPRR